MKLFGKTSILAIAAVAAVAFSISTAHAQETETVDVEVTVANACNLVVDTDMSFGSIVAVRRGVGAGAAATFELAADGTPTITNVGGANDDFIIAISGEQEAELSVDGALAATAMSIILPAAPATLSCALCVNPANPDFTLDTFVSSEPLNAFTTDGAGEYAFTVGATLSTVSGTEIYEDGLYEGTYDVTVTY